MANARDHLAATSDGEGTVWLMGGRVGGLTSNLAIVETVTAGEIDHVAELPTPRGGVAAFHTDELGACLTGGEAPDQAYTVVECVGDDGASPRCRRSTSRTTATARRWSTGSSTCCSAARADAQRRLDRRSADARP